MNLERDKKIIEKRIKISIKYCKKKNYNYNNLSLEQLLEIRNLKEWKNPVLN